MSTETARPDNNANLDFGTTQRALSFSLDDEKRMHHENELRYPVIAPHTCVSCLAIPFDVRSIDSHNEYSLSSYQGDGTPTKRRVHSGYTGIKLWDFLSGAIAGCELFRFIIDKDSELRRMVNAWASQQTLEETVFTWDDLITWKISYLPVPGQRASRPFRLTMFRNLAKGAYGISNTRIGTFDMYEYPGKPDTLLSTTASTTLEGKLT